MNRAIAAVPDPTEEGSDTSWDDRSAGSPLPELPPLEELLIPFYRGEGRDIEGRSLSEMHAFNPDQLESNHTYIQWLFPLDSESASSGNAPLLNERTIRLMREDSLVQENLRHSFRQMLFFYGLTEEGDELLRAENFQERCFTWLSEGNHNFLRITRIIKSLRLLGLEEEASKFGHFMIGLAATPQAKTIGSRSFGFWERVLTIAIE